MEPGNRHPLGLKDCMTSEELRLLRVQYTPSEWNNRFRPQDCVEKHVEIVTELSQEARDRVGVRRNVRYGNNPRELLDIYGESKLPKDAPIFVYVHGGYWQDLNKDISSYPAIPLVRAGIKVMVVDYDLCPDFTLQEILNEIVRCAKFVLEYAVEHNVKSVWFGGHSAGAHLISWLLKEGSVPDHLMPILKGMILISGIYDLTPLIYTSENDALRLNKETAKAVSPYYIQNYSKVAQRNTELCFVATRGDSGQFWSQTVFYQLLLGRNSFRAHFTMYPDDDHFTIAESLANSRAPLTSQIVNAINRENK